MKLSKPINMSLSASFTTTKAAEEDGPLRIKGYANTVSRDRAGDVIPMDAWMGKTAMPNYEKNPIILAFHNHSMPIGKMINYNITEMGLEIEAEISKSAGPIYNLIQDGILKTFSVGFRCLDAEWKREEDIYLIKELELFEISVVSVPCNQDSVFEVSKSLNSSDFNDFRTQLQIEASNKSDDTQEVSILEKLAIELGIRKK